MKKMNESGVGGENVKDFILSLQKNIIEHGEVS